MFDIALEEKKEELLFSEAQTLMEIIAQDDELVRFMKHPKIVKEKKLETGKVIFEKSFSKEFAGFLLLLVQKDRFSEIEKILDYFIGRVKEYKKIGIAYVSTAADLSEEQKAKIEKRLLETTDFKSLEMNYSVDKTLLGGMVIRIGDRVVDTSMKNKLRELERRCRLG